MKSAVLTAIAMSLASGAPFEEVYPMPREPEEKAPPDVTAAVMAAAEAKRLRKAKRRAVDGSAKR